MKWTPTFVYLLQFPNRLCYVGVTVDVDRRFKDHAHSNSLVGRAIRKYGRSNVRRYILLVASEQIAYEMEAKFVDILHTLHPNGYNLVRGGRVGPRHTIDTKTRISVSLQKLRKEVGFPEEHLRRIKASAIVRYQSAEARQETRKAQLLRYLDPEEHLKSTSAQLVAWTNEERRKHYREMALKQWSDPNMRQKMVKNMKGSKG